MQHRPYQARFVAKLASQHTLRLPPHQRPGETDSVPCSWIAWSAAVDPPHIDAYVWCRKWWSAGINWSVTAMAGPEFPAASAKISGSKTGLE